jgi:acetyl esterase/lipase
MKKIITLIIFSAIGIIGFSQEINFLKELNIPYYSSSITQSDKYLAEKCLLDVYYPEKLKRFATLVWFHGGGLSDGNKNLPAGLNLEDAAVVCVGYRLNPKVKCPVYIEDAAAAVAWVFHNIEKYGGDPRLIFVVGHSAGAYLTTMVGLDKKWLAVNHVDANRIAGLFSLSGNGVTHPTIRKEKGISELVPVVDEFAPLFHVRADAPPLILMTGDRELEYNGRYEENAYMARMMKLVGHKETKLFEFDGYGHGMRGPGFPLVYKHIHLISEQIREAGK